jgi:DNA-binding transcriptional regulator YiaG
MTVERQHRAKSNAERIRAIRLERFGQDVAALATVLNIPERTWLNYEQGVVMPAHVMLGFLVICEVDPGWMLNGRKRQMRPSPQDA